MHLIGYVSNSLIPKENFKRDVENIARSSSENNMAQNITGILFFKNGEFLQIIEGREKDLRAVMKRIENDTRHENVTYVIDEPIKEAGFQTWSMHFLDLDSPTKYGLKSMRHIREGFQKNNLNAYSKVMEFYNSLMR